MKGAIFYTTKYGSTRDYARWIGDATDLPIFDLQRGDGALEALDFVVLGCPIYFHRVLGAAWIRRHLPELRDKPVVLFTVSGAPAGPKLDAWIAASLPQQFIDRAYRFALLGRQSPKKLTWHERVLLVVGGLFNPDRKAGREEIQGFDFMEKASIEPVVDLINTLKARDGPSSVMEGRRVARDRVS